MNDNDILVGIQLFESSQKNKIGFTELVKILEGKLTRNEVCKGLDHLFDLGLAEGEYASVGKISKRILFLTKEGEIIFEPIINKIKER